jgi:hypothetical protein
LISQACDVADFRKQSREIGGSAGSMLVLTIHKTRFLAISKANGLWAPSI